MQNFKMNLKTLSSNVKKKAKEIVKPIVMKQASSGCASCGNK